MSVKVSSKFQVVIPEPVRSALNIKAGTQVEVIEKGKIAYLIPVQSLQSLTNELRGKLDQKAIRDKKDRSL